MLLVQFSSGNAISQELWFEEIASERSGIDFRFDSGSRGKFDLPEIMGGGMAAADFDGDGRLDLFFCQGGPIDSKHGQGSQHDGKIDSKDPPCLWYRNLGGMRFRRVEVPLAGPSYAMGAWPGDYDSDGLVDLFVTGWQGWALYRNRGNWNFEDTTASLGGDVSRWSTAAVWCDFDRDGNPDLFVGGYLDYDAARAPFCAAPDGQRDYCGPEDFSPVPNRLFRNDGKGGFVDVSERLGESRKSGRSLGAIAADFDADGRMDYFVANDGSACELLLQKPDGTFADEAIARGLAFDRDGRPLAAMGVALGNFQGRGSQCLFVTNFFERGTVLFESTRSGVFIERSSETGLKAVTRRFNGFGIAVEDFDGDGHPEILQANGHVLSRERLGTPMAMPAALIRSSEASRFEPLGDEQFPIANRAMLGRGVIVADLDEDGKPDILISRLDGPPILLRNIIHRVKSPTSRIKTFGGSYLSGVLAPVHSSREP